MVLCLGMKGLMMGCMMSRERKSKVRSLGYPELLYDISPITGGFYHVLSSN